jgi:hypothetical protein
VRSELSWRTHLLTIGFVYVGMHTIMVFAAISLVDTSTRPNVRTMLPAFVALLAGIAAWLGGLRPESPLRMRAVALIIATGLLSAAISQTTLAVRAIASRALDFNSPEWRNSRLLSLTRRLPDSALFSNAPDAIYFITGRSTWSIPALYDFRTGKANPHFEQELATMRRLMEDRGGAVVIFYDIGRPYLPSIDRLMSESHLRLLHQEADGQILGP